GSLSGVDLLADLLDVGEGLVELLQARAQAADALPELALILRADHVADGAEDVAGFGGGVAGIAQDVHHVAFAVAADAAQIAGEGLHVAEDGVEDRKSTRLNSSHLGISYAVFCLKKKTKTRDAGAYGLR